MVKRRTSGLVLVSFMFASSLVATGCPNPPHPPAAQTPVIETILAVGSWVNAAYHHSGVYEMPPGNAIELRFRAPSPTTTKIAIDGVELPEVSDTSDHQELNETGYYRKPMIDLVSAEDPLFFWRVFVSLPRHVWGSGDYSVTIDNISQDESLTGAAKKAPSLTIAVVRLPPASPRPSSVFFSGPDAKHTNTGGDSAFIRNNVTLAGWLVATPGRGLDDPATEDWHYDIYLDDDFIKRNYPAANNDLDNAVMPGRWFTQLDALFHPNMRIPLTTGPPSAGTFLIPGTGLFTVEMNAWHPSRHGGIRPAGWVGDVDPATWPDVVWPFPVMRPIGLDASEPDLREGDYVVITGALIQDAAHLHFDQQNATTEDRRHECWHRTHQGHGGWLEIHPLDSIRRVPTPQAPRRRKHPVVIQVCREDPPGQTPLLVDTHLTPIPAEPPSPNSVLRYSEQIDERFTDMSKIQKHVVEVNPSTFTDLHVHVMLNPNVEATFKAVYLLWWEETSQLRPSPSTYVAPTPSDDDGLPPVCGKKPYLPQCELRRDDNRPGRGK
jgi:hypothetical protein